MGTRTTTAGKVKIGLALDPHAYQLLQAMASSPRKLGTLLDDLICAEAARRGDALDERSSPNEAPPCSESIGRQLDQGAQQKHQADILSHIAEPVVTLDADRRIIGWNRAAQELFFWTVDQAIGRPVNEVIPQEPIASTLGAVYDELDAQGSWRGEVVVHRRDGTDLSMESTWAVARDETGRILYRIGAMRDITERKRAERALSLQAERLRSLSHHLVTLQEAQQKALSRELHDRSGQSLTALKIGLGMLRRKAEGSSSLQARVDELLQMADQAAAELHDLAVSLRPSELDRYGLVPALEQLIASFRKQTAADVELTVTGLDEARLASNVETALYRLVQEGLTNVARHARASHVSIILGRESDTVSLIIEDDGCGFDPDEAFERGRLGLLGMRERAEMLDGTLSIESKPGRGTTVYVQAPATQAAALQAAADPGQSTETNAAAAGSRLLRLGAQQELAGLPDGSTGQSAAELARAKALSDVLVEIAASIGRCSSADEILRLVLARSAGAIGRDNAHIALRDGDSWELRYGYRELPQPRRYRNREAPAFAWVERTRQTLVVNDTSAPDVADDALRLTAHGVKSYACIPLLAGDILLGVLNFANYAVPAPFLPSEVEFLNRLANLVALALENGQLHEIERLQREEYQRLAAERDATLSSVADGLVIYNVDGEIVRMNATAQEVFGYSPAERELPMPERVGRISAAPADGEYGGPETLPAYRAVHGETVRGSLWIMTRHSADPSAPDRQRWISTSAAPIRDGEGRQIGAVASFSDVTEFRRVQDELAKRVEELETLLELLPAGIGISYDPGCADIRVNPALAKMLAMSRDANVSLSADKSHKEAAYRVFDQTGRELPVEELPMQAAALTGSEVRDQVIEIVREDGVKLTLLAYAAPLVGAAGERRGAIGAYVDISQLRAAEVERERLLTELQERHRELVIQAEEIHALNATLERRVQERTAALAETMEALRQSEAHFQLALRNSPIVVFEQDLDLCYTWIHNPHPGFDPAAVLGKTEYELLPPASASQLVALKRRALETGIGERREVSLEIAGLTVVYDMIVEPLRDQAGVVRGLTCASTDITERKRAEETIRRQAARAEALVRTAQRLNAQLSLEAVLQAVCEETAQALQAPAASVALYDEARGEIRHAAGYGLPTEYANRVRPMSRTWYDEIVKRVGPILVLPDIQATGSASADADLYARLDIRSVVGTSMLRNGELVGGLNIFTFGLVRHFSEDDLLLLQGLANQAATAIANARLLQQLEANQAQLRALSRRLVDVQERERRDVADQLYNEANQVLAALKMHLARSEGRAADAYVSETRAMLDRVMHDLHHLATHLRPVSLDRLGLAPALQQYAEEWGREHGLPVQFLAPEGNDCCIGADAETALYRVVQEALANVAQHARATRVAISVRRVDSRFILMVEDDGAGFEPAAAAQRGALGLLSMQERVEAVGGRLIVDSVPASGTTVIVEVPTDSPQ